MRQEPGVVRVYSRSLLEAVTTTGQIRQYVDDAEALRIWYLAQPRLRTFLEGPHIAEKDKASLIEKVLGGGRIPPLLFNLIRLLVRKKRILLFADVLAEFRLIAEEALGQLVAQVTTAIPMDPTRQAKLKERLEAATDKKFKLDFRVDPEVFGGVLVKYKDVIIDGTLRGRLWTLRSRLEAVA